MAVKRLLAGLALLSIAEKALATKDHVASNVATCDLTAVTHSSSLSVSVAAEAVKSVNSFLCDESEGIPEKASAHALALADSFVNAVVDTTASCYAEGYASYKINGGSVAYAQATAIAKAYAEASASAETCYKCLAATSLIAHSYEEIFLEATSRIDVTLQGIADGATASDSVSASAKTFIEITVIALAEVLVKAHAEVDKCASALQATVKTGDKTDANSVTCQLDSTATDDEVVRNACVAVSTSVAAHVCGEGLADATFEVEAQAIGNAMAIAITQVTLDCQVEGKGTVCALGKADMIKTAEAVAYAFAFGYVSATSSCNTVCHTDVSVLTEAVGSVLATATSHSLESQCTGPDSYFDIDYVEKQIVEASITALAKILTAATATSEGDCVIALEIEAAVAPGEEQLVSGPALEDRQSIAPVEVTITSSNTDDSGDPTSKSQVEPAYAPVTEPYVDSDHPDHEEKPEVEPEHPEYKEKPYVQPEHPDHTDNPEVEPEHPEPEEKPYVKPEHPDHQEKPYVKPGHPDHQEKPYVKPEHPHPTDKSHEAPVHAHTPVPKPHPKPDVHPEPERPTPKPHYKSGNPAKPSPPQKGRPSTPTRRPAPKQTPRRRPATRMQPKKKHSQKVQRKKANPGPRRRSSSRAPRRSRRRRAVRRSRRRRSAIRSRRPRSVRRSRRRRSGRKPSRPAGKQAKKTPASRRPTPSGPGIRRPHTGGRGKKMGPQTKRSRRIAKALAAARKRRQRERRQRDIRARRAGRGKREARRGRKPRSVL